MQQQLDAKFKRDLYRIIQPDHLVTYRQIWDSRDGRPQPEWGDVRPILPEKLPGLKPLVVSEDEDLAAKLLVHYYRTKGHTNVTFTFNNMTRSPYSQGFPLIDGYIRWTDREGRPQQKAIELKSVHKEGFDIVTSEAQLEAIRSARGEFFVIKTTITPGQDRYTRNSDYRTHRIECYLQAPEQIKSLNDIIRDERQQQEARRAANIAAAEAARQQSLGKHGFTISGFGPLSKRKR